MKLLVIGMDGAHLDAFSRGWTPYMKSLLDQGSSIELKEDLISRGWLEIATGKNGLETGALYDKPMANGSYEWNLKFSLNDVPGLGEAVKPIWQLLSERGYKVGVMNLPTVFPAPPVNGFMISGGGGGAPVVQTPTPELCFPREEHSELVEEGYIVDERIVPMMVDKGITDPEKIFSILVHKNERRTHSFIRLAKKHSIDFGMIVFKSSANLAEWVLLPELKRLNDGQKNIDYKFINTIKSYYQKFDEEIKKLHESFPNAQIIFTADHGLTPRIWDVNPNILLQDIGLQVADNTKTRARYISQALKKFIPFSWRAKLRKKKTIHDALYSSAPFKKEQTYAFCKTSGDWLQGIYLNDSVRFGGPIGPDEASKVAHDIVTAINGNPIAKEHGITAYHKSPCDSAAAKYYPDIVIDVPDGYLISDKAPSFVRKFIPPKGPLNLMSITKGELLCIKSHKPLAVVYNGGWNLSSVKENLDLSAIYEHISNEFS
ncbi:hypothetical protein DXI23_01495 [Marinobacter flavimaris]|uniref:Phosphodiesterase n=1 Tax=Marinobacter flavimaris TaxID=262076 RepID=A0A3D8H6L6_9GAMM|nr:alkaline phosphatase family protein [Marinobacter flavimaris]PPI81934.1 hypothetical protein MDHKLMBL_01495 [Marinobacter flavimaris]RDU42385.1 hypothetical protein DXI23_01495 [Marinobacter flavimaris]